jgi:hypothetical protein
LERLDHLASPLALRLLAHRSAALLVAHTAMKNQPDEAAKAMSDRADGLMVTKRGTSRRYTI